MVNNPFQYNVFDRIKGFFLQKSALSRLMLINIVVWIVVMFVNVLTWLFAKNNTSLMLDWFAVPANLATLAHRPWTVFTYMFLQEGFGHLFFNMLVLYFGGVIFLQFMSQRQLVYTYIVGGLTGALFFILAYNTFPVFEDAVYASVALGSSASVLSVLVSAATIRPNYDVNLLFLGKIKMKWVAIILVVVDFLSINRNNPGGHIAHLGGAFWGFLYTWLLMKGTDVYIIFKFHSHKYKKRYKSGTFKSPDYNKRPKTDEQYNKERAEEQMAIDDILDKISKYGYSSLSDSEKEFLFKQSKKY